MHEMAKNEEKPAPQSSSVATESGAGFRLAELSAMGVKRVSVGSAFARRAYGAVLDAAKEMRERGTFTFARDAVPFVVIDEMFAR